MKENFLIQIYIGKFKGGIIPLDDVILWDYRLKIYNRSFYYKI